MIISSGYFVEEEDFLSLVRTLQVAHCSDHIVERANLLEFFTLAAQLFSFSSKKVSDILTGIWEHQAASEMMELNSNSLEQNSMIAYQ